MQQNQQLQVGSNSSEAPVWGTASKDVWFEGSNNEMSETETERNLETAGAYCIWGELQLFCLSLFHRVVILHALNVSQYVPVLCIFIMCRAQQ